MSSFSGKIKEYPQISVDRFDGRHLASTAYFLSHHHSDHMHGLSSPQFLDHFESNSGVYLYCSPITAKLLQTNIRYRPLSPFIRPLQIEESVKITIPNIAEDAGQHLWVTLIPAAHCPGSVMFLFEGRGGTVLYTGDFRLSMGEASRIRPLHTVEGTVRTIDHLHIDTTFCHKDIMRFPSREESLTALLGLVEDWLARGNNYLIHLDCPAKYGYEFVYRGIHERFGMRIHVSHWKYRMYASVPEILAILTSDATETWIHACDGNAKENNDGDDTGTKQLPCHCVPYGVDAEPNIRVIRPSAMYFAFYQSVREIKQVNSTGTFCRVLLSMHASCSEILDLVSYLRPRKVSPNVIPFNSTREEVLKLLHEALNRSGDHYSIEYESNQRRSMGSFKRQLDVSDSSSNSGGASNSMLEAGMLDSFMSSPNKKRRHSDSNMTLLIPTPRGNIKGSLSLEGEARHDLTREESVDTTEDNVPPTEELVWQDPYSESPQKSQSEVELCLDEVSQTQSPEDGDHVGGHMKRNSSSSKSRASATTENEERSSCSALKLSESQDSIELCSVFSDEDPQDESIARPSSSNGVAGESSIKRSRRLWYKHKYFSTPVHEETDGQATETRVPRSSSLPLPDHLCLGVLSQEDPSSQVEEHVPLITISSPLDPGKEPTQTPGCEGQEPIKSRADTETVTSKQYSNTEIATESRDETKCHTDNGGYRSKRMTTVACSTFDSGIVNCEGISENCPIDADSANTSQECNDTSVSTRLRENPGGWIAPLSASGEQSEGRASSSSSDIEEVYCSVVAESRPSVICAPILKNEGSTEEEGANGKWIDCGLPKLRNKFRRTSSFSGRGVKRKLSDSPQLIDISEDSNNCCTNLELEDACARSSCLKTAKRNLDEVQVFSLDRAPL